MSLPSILVTTARGKTGFATATRLLEQGQRVRAFVHRRDARAEALQAAGAELFVGELHDWADCSAALEGVQRAYFCSPMVRGGLFTSAVFAAAARDAGLEVLVAMSQWLADPEHPTTATRETWLADRLFDWTGIDTITVNPGWFAWNYTLVLEPISQLGLMPMPLGQGRNAPVSTADLGAVIASLLIDPGPYIGKTYRPTGPELMDPQQLAATFARVLGRKKVRYQDISDRLFNKALRAAGWPAFPVSQLVHYAEEYRRGAFERGGPTNVVEALTGRLPETFEAAVRRAVADQAAHKRSLARRLRAGLGFARIMLTRPHDLDAYLRDAEHQKPRNPRYVGLARGWLAQHDEPGAFGVTRPQFEPCAPVSAELEAAVSEMRPCQLSRARALSRAVSRAYDEALRPIGVKASQLPVLAAIGSLEPARPGAVSAALHLDQSSLSRAIATLKASGWVEVKVLSHRHRTLALTEEGRALVLRALPRWRAVQQRVLERLGPLPDIPDDLLAP